jgi:hypothetical protein
MAFTPQQVGQILRVLGLKVTQPCPSCAQIQKRQIVSELFLLTAIRTPATAPVTALSTLAAMGAPTNIPAAPQSLPCISTICTNCGFTELYNVHVLGLAAALGVPPPGAPIY